MVQALQKYDMFIYVCRLGIGCSIVPVVDLAKIFQESGMAMENHPKSECSRSTTIGIAHHRPSSLRAFRTQ